jgi:hypothetical protein
LDKKVKGIAVIQGSRYQVVKPLNAALVACVLVIVGMLIGSVVYRCSLGGSVVETSGNDTCNNSTIGCDEVLKENKKLRSDNALLSTENAGLKSDAAMLKMGSERNYENDKVYKQSIAEKDKDIEVKDIVIDELIEENAERVADIELKDEVIEEMMEVNEKLRSDNERLSVVNELGLDEVADVIVGLLKENEEQDIINEDLYEMLDIANEEKEKAQELRKETVEEMNKKVNNPAIKRGLDKSKSVTSAIKDVMNRVCEHVPAWVPC